VIRVTSDTDAAEMARLLVRTAEVLRISFPSVCHSATWFSTRTLEAARRQAWEFLDDLPRRLFFHLEFNIGEGLLTAAGQNSREFATRRRLPTTDHLGPETRAAAAQLERETMPRSIIGNDRSASVYPRNCGRDPRSWVANNPHGRITGFPPEGAS
jgi:hypothetical protein